MDKQQVPEVIFLHPLISLSWEELPSLPVPMRSANAVWHEGRLHVGGGHVDKDATLEELAKLFVYSPEFKSWTDFSTPTCYYGLVVYNDRLTLVGGIEYFSGSITNKIWQAENISEDGIEKWNDNALPPLLVRRYDSSVVSQNELMIVAGGKSQNDENTNSIEMYNSKQRQWFRSGTLRSPSSNMSCTIIGSNILYFTGGECPRRLSNNVYQYRFSREYDSESLAFPAELKVPLSHSSIISLYGILLAIGGYRYNKRFEESSSRSFKRNRSALRLSLSSSMFAFSATTQSWHHFFNLPLPLEFICMTLSPSGKLIAIGGVSSAGECCSRVFQLNVEPALVFSNIIIKSVENRLLAPLERALKVVMAYSTQLNGSPLLDFLACSSSDSPRVSATEHSMTHSPLMIACENEDTSMVNVLLDNGASPDYKNKDHVTALHIACKKGNLELVQRLVKKRQSSQNILKMSDVEGQTVLHYACVSSFGGETLKWLLKKKAVRDMLNMRTNTGFTPLLKACQNANVPAVQELVKHDQVDVTVCDENKHTALHLAAIQDSSVIVEMLLKKGCPPDTQDTEGNTALHMAYKKSSNSVITVLMHEDDGRVKVIMNNAGQYPADIEPDDVIPPEIKKRGPKAVELYLMALVEGKTKIPRCNLVILGQERVGKTSLYRLLVRKGFDPNQDSTRGIDNTVVETLDRRHVVAEDWSEKDERMVEEHAEHQFVRGVVGALPSHLLAQSESTSKIVTERQLNEEISELELTLSNPNVGQLTNHGSIRRTLLPPQTTASSPLPPNLPSSENDNIQPQVKDTPKASQHSLSSSESEDPKPQVKDIDKASQIQDRSINLPSSHPGDEQPRSKDVAEAFLDLSPPLSLFQQEYEESKASIADSEDLKKDETKGTQNLLSHIPPSSSSSKHKHPLSLPRQSKQPQVESEAEGPRDLSSHIPPSLAEREQSLSVPSRLSKREAGEEASEPQDLSTPISPLQSQDEQPQLKDIAESNHQDPTGLPRVRKSKFSKLKRFFKFRNIFRKKRPRELQQDLPHSIPLPPVSVDSKSESDDEHQSLIDESSPAEVLDQPLSDENSPLAQTAAKLSNKQAMMINKELTTASSKEKVDPVLLLNALDFAGQQEYRPMHHCFLTRLQCTSWCSTYNTS